MIRVYWRPFAVHSPFFGRPLIPGFQPQFLKQIKAKGGVERARLFRITELLFPGPRAVVRSQLPHVLLDQGDNVIAKRAPILLGLYFRQFQQILGAAKSGIFTHWRFLFGHFVLILLHNGRQSLTHVVTQAVP